MQITINLNIDDRYINFFKKIILIIKEPWKRIGSLVILFISVALVLQADVITKPNTFSSGGLISASDVNANFDALYTESNAQHGRIAVLEGKGQWEDNGSGDVYYPNGNVGIGTTNPSASFEVNGIIRSSSGGFTFPDATTQTTAGITPSSWSTAGMTCTAPYSVGSISYKKIDGIVHLKGFGNASGTRVWEGQDVCILPAGFRPPGTAQVVVATWGWPGAKPGGWVGSVGVHIFSSGQIRVISVHQYNGEQQYIQFDSVSFSVD